MPPFHLDRFIPHIAANSRRAVFQHVTHQIADDLGRSAAGIENALHPEDGHATHTPLGDGVMVVDAYLDGIDAPYALLAQLKHPVDVHAPDHKGADLIFVMVSPESDRSGHLRRVAGVMRQMHDVSLRELLRQVHSLDAARMVMTSTSVPLIIRRAA